MKLQIFFSKSDGFAVSYELKCAVRAAILATLKYEGFPFDAEVSVTFADNEYIHGLNNENSCINACDSLCGSLYHEIAKLCSGLMNTGSIKENKLVLPYSMYTCNTVTSGLGLLGNDSHLLTKNRV